MINNRVGPSFKRAAALVAKTLSCLLMLTVITGLQAPSAIAQPSPPVLEPSNVGLTDTIVLLPATGTLNAEGTAWLIDIHAWVAIPARSRVRKAAAEGLLKQLYGLEVTAAARPLFDRRIDLLFADNKGRRRLTAEIAGARYPLNPTGSNGHSITTVNVPMKAVDAAKASNDLTATLLLPARDVRKISTTIELIPREGLSIISDIDDTVKISHVTDRKKLLSKTFLEPFAPVAGMAQLMARVGGRDTPVHYVSSSPWHLAEPLLEFMRDARLPVSELSLKYIRIKDGTIFDLTKSPEVTKPPQIRAILERFPQRQFVLIGDNGESDPEVYGAIARAYPKRIARILIRNCCPEKASDARFAKAFAGLPRDLWQVFTSPDEVKTVALPSTAQ